MSDQTFDISLLKPKHRNPRKITPTQLEKLKQSLTEFTKMLPLRPIVYDPATNEVLGGNQRLEALKQLGYTLVPSDWVRSAEGMTEDEKRRFIIADNSSFGEWDTEILSEDWSTEELAEWGLEGVLAFDGDIEPEKPEHLEAQEDDYEIPDEINTDIVLGDLFEIGPHRLLCGDSTDSDAVERLMGGEKADITFTSPPYNVGKTPNGDEQKYLNDNDKKTTSAYVNLLDSFTKNSLLFSDYVFSNIQSLSGNKIALIEHLHNLKSMYADVMIWDKQTAEPAMQRKVLNSRFEYIYIFSNEAKRSIGKKDFRGTIDNIFSLNSRQGKEYANVHKATFPVQLPSFFIENFSINSIIDMFCGTGTTMVAAHKLKRKCYGMELDPKYCQVIVDRMLKLDPSLTITRNGKPYERQ